MSVNLEEDKTMNNKLLEHVDEFIEENKKDGGHCSYCLGYNMGMMKIRNKIESYLNLNLILRKIREIK